MKIPENLQFIEVYYDGHCGMCCTFHEWVNQQARAIDVRFIPYQDKRAEEWFPGVHQLEPEREMIVRTDQNAIYRGAEGWVLCLLSCEKYQGIARKLASPRLLPFAQKVCHALAARRRTISKIIFTRKEREVATMLHKMPEAECSGNCGVKEKIPN